MNLTEEQIALQNKLKSINQERYDALAINEEVYKRVKQEILDEFSLKEDEIVKQCEAIGHIDNGGFMYSQCAVCGIMDS